MAAKVNLKSYTGSFDDLISAVEIVETYGAHYIHVLRAMIDMSVPAPYLHDNYRLQIWLYPESPDKRIRYILRSDLWKLQMWLDVHDIKMKKRIPIPAQLPLMTA